MTAHSSNDTAKLPIAFIENCKKRGGVSKVADSTGVDLSGKDLLLRTLISMRLLRREVLTDDEKYVGMLLPPSVGGALVNMALTLDHRIAVNLNYTVTSEVLNACIRQCGIKHVLTSRKFMEKMSFDLDAEVVFVDDLREKVKLSDKLSALWLARMTSTDALVRKLKLDKIKSSDILTVIFTSGSTGEPKGVMLTHEGVWSCVDGIDQVVHLTSDDVVIGILPFFHSFGYTVTLCTLAGLDIKAAYHFSPLDGKQVGKLCQTHRGTVLLSTPTFLRTYLRRCTPEEFATLDVVVAGAEKLPSELCDAFEAKFGTRPVEGYGATELSPLVSVNVPPSRSSKPATPDLKEGTVGRPIPNVRARIVDLDDGHELGANESGMLHIAGPNVMKGYLGKDELTAEVVKEGWYVTGDVAQLDENGFIEITGRVSRFSKIGGEMVPHIKIEESILSLLGTDEEETVVAAVTAVPDQKKGERLIVVHRPMDKSASDVCRELTEMGLPNIFIPTPDSFLEVEEIPVLGTGKLDLRGLKKLAVDAFAEK